MQKPEKSWLEGDRQTLQRGWKLAAGVGGLVLIPKGHHVTELTILDCTLSLGAMEDVQAKELRGFRFQKVGSSE